MLRRRLFIAAAVIVPMVGLAIIVAMLMPSKANFALIRVHDASTLKPLTGRVTVVGGERTSVGGGEGAYWVHWFGWSGVDVTIYGQGYHPRTFHADGGQVHVELKPRQDPPPH